MNTRTVREASGIAAQLNNQMYKRFLVSAVDALNALCTAVKNVVIFLPGFFSQNQKASYFCCFADSPHPF